MNSSMKNPTTTTEDLRAVLVSISVNIETANNLEQFRLIHQTLETLKESLESLHLKFFWKCLSKGCFFGKSTPQHTRLEGHRKQVAPDDMGFGPEE